jgi:hypothetical protein
VIDLEDRLLDQRWQALGTTLDFSSDSSNNNSSSSVGGGGGGGGGVPKKPVENRTLYPAHSTGAAVWARLRGGQAGAGQGHGSQGQVRLWVDILSKNESRAPGNAPVDIALAPTLEWELRVIIVSTRAASC